MLKIADDWRFLDEAADAASLFGGLLTFGLLNTLLIDTVKSDLTAYLTSQLVGSPIAHAERMWTAFAKMLARKFCRAISDKKIHNCWHYVDAKKGNLVSNPHDLYGYLMHQDTAGFVAQWAG